MVKQGEELQFTRMRTGPQGTVSRRGQPLHNHIHLRLKEVFGVAGLGEHAEGGGIPGVWAQGGCRW